MSKEAVENSSKKSNILLELCKKGEIVENGYNLWVHTDILRWHGISYSDIGTNEEEVRTYLIQDLKHWISQIKDGSEDICTSYLDLAILHTYFLEDDSENGSAFPVSYSELGLTPDELNQIKKQIDIRASKQDIQTNSG